MGGKNAVVVLEDADLELAVEGIAQGAFGSTGQRCTATSRVIVLEAVKEQFLNLLVARTRRVRVGSGFTPGVEVAPLASESQFRKVSGYIEEGRREGARLVHGGGVPAGDDYQRGFYLEPTIFAEVQPSMRIFQEEIFGPVVSIATAKTFEEAVRFANDVKYGLSASIYTRDLDRAFRFVDQAEVGMVHINSPTLGGEAHVPFGGIKASGLGEREQGSTAVDFFTEDIVVYIDYTGRKRDAKFI
jgi:aldehyde dehydrogenase (NAD+)